MASSGSYNYKTHKFTCFTWKPKVKKDINKNNGK